ncbi:MAG TPA: hypothetical protein VKR43_12425 [Bryobacteraceae bacterium]|nr:hypothetical protein [Bryobacteraceae bacterium]
MKLKYPGWNRGIPAFLIVCALCSSARASEADALAISANIRAVHLPFGTILNPIYASPTGTQIAGYTRCGDSALWTGAWLAAEAFRYNVTQSPDALNNVRTALAGLKALADVTGDNRLARCMVLANSPYAPGIASEEASNTVHSNPPWLWVDNTSRDQLVGAFFGMGAAYDLVNDAGVQSGISDLATRLLGYVAGHLWSPNDDISNTFLLRPEELQMMFAVVRHVNPASTIGGPLITLPVNTGVVVDVQSTDSYFKFNLDFMTFYNLIRLQDNGDNRSAYQIARNYTAGQQNAFFDVIDRGLNGANPARDAETLTLLNQWLQRSRRDFPVNLSGVVPVCGSQACQPIPVVLRPPDDFLWQETPFQLAGGGKGIIETAGIDYILPYWMARYYGVVPALAVQSAAAPNGAVTPASIASLYGSNLASETKVAGVQPPPLSLGGITLMVTDSADVARGAPLMYVSPTQINFVVPAGTASGTATFTILSAGAPLTTTGTVQPVAPTLFSMSGDGKGVAAASAISLQAADPSIQSPVAVFSCDSSGCFSTPIGLGVDTPVILTLYGTGIRNRSALSNVSVTINGISAQVQYAGVQPTFAGLDQVNIALPLTLRGSGEVNVVMTVDGQTANVVVIDIN